MSAIRPMAQVTFSKQQQHTHSHPHSHSDTHTHTRIWKNRLTLSQQHSFGRPNRPVTYFPGGTSVGVPTVKSFIILTSSCELFRMVNDDPISKEKKTIWVLHWSVFLGGGCGCGCGCGCGWVSRSLAEIQTPTKVKSLIVESQWNRESGWRERREWVSVVVVVVVVWIVICAHGSFCWHCSQAAWKLPKPSQLISWGFALESPHDFQPRILSAGGPGSEFAPALQAYPPCHFRLCCICFAYACQYVRESNE